MILVLDIDGTLADLSHREFLVADKPTADWDTFFSNELIYKDRVIPGAVEGYKILYDLADKVYIVSGRPESALSTTEQWLVENDFDLAKLLGSIILRPEDVTTSSREFKQAIVESVILPENDLDQTYIFIDDEERNLEMFSQYGLALKAPEIWKDIIGISN
jgi:hydroxymethylpyrimidine pyrophosphatase-like HAD family hydrolase